jgi:sphingomyelin phosphodiesterase 2
VFTEHVPGKPYSFSDHFGLEATFSIHLPEGQPGNVNDPSDIEVPAPAPNTITKNRPPGAKLDPSQQVSAVPNLQQANPPPGLSDASVTTLIQALTTSYRISRSNHESIWSVFFVSLFLIIGLIVGSAWLPHSWINPSSFSPRRCWRGWRRRCCTPGSYTGNYEANTLVIL